MSQALILSRLFGTCRVQCQGGYDRLFSLADGSLFSGAKKAVEKCGGIHEQHFVFNGALQLIAVDMNDRPALSVIRQPP